MKGIYVNLENPTINGDDRTATNLPDRFDPWDDGPDINLTSYLINNNQWIVDTYMENILKINKSCIFDPSGIIQLPLVSYNSEGVEVKTKK